MQRSSNDRAGTRPARPHLPIKTIAPQEGAALCRPGYGNVSAFAIYRDGSTRNRSGSRLQPDFHGNIEGGDGMRQGT